MSIVFTLNKGSRSLWVQAGLIVVSAALLSACGKEPAPAESAPARLAATSPQDMQNADSAELPVVIVTASREHQGEI